VPTQTGPGPGGATITYATSGGIAGVRRELVITPEGFATLTDEGNTYGPLSLPQERRDEIKAKIDAANFNELQERYGTGSVSDDFLHTLTVAEGGSAKSVTVEEVGGDDVTPAPVQELFTLMDAVEKEVRELATTTPTPAPASYTGPILFTAVREATNEEWEMTLTEGGEATLVEGGKPLGTLQVAPEKLEDIRAKLARAGFFTLKAYYGSGFALPNDRVFTINLRAGGKTKIVSMEDHGSYPVTPQSVIDLFQAVSRVYLSSRLQLQGTPVSAP
jgi:hypothetical protein